MFPILILTSMIWFYWKDKAIYTTTANPELYNEVNENITSRCLIRLERQISVPTDNDLYVNHWSYN